MIFACGEDPELESSQVGWLCISEYNLLVVVYIEWGDATMQFRQKVLGKEPKLIKRNYQCHYYWLCIVIASALAQGS